MKRLLTVMVAVFGFGTVAGAAEPVKREQPAKPAKAVKLTKNEMASITAGAQPPPGLRGESNKNNTNNNNNNPPTTAK